MKLLEHSKSDTGYKIRIWLDETKFDLQGKPYEEWVADYSWGLQPPMNDVEDGANEDGSIKLKQVPAMSQQDYEKSQVEEATRHAQEVLAKLSANSTQVTQPKSL